MLDQSAANRTVELTDDLVAKLKRLPDIELARVAQQLVVDSRMTNYFRHAIFENERAREDARANLCSDLHGR